MPLSEAREVGFSLRYVIDAYRESGAGGQVLHPDVRKGWSARDGCAG